MQFSSGLVKQCFCKRHLSKYIFKNFNGIYKQTGKGCYNHKFSFLSKITAGILTTLSRKKVLKDRSQNRLFRPDTIYPLLNVVILFNFMVKFSLYVFQFLDRFLHACLLSILTSANRFTPTGRLLKSVHNRCVIEDFGGVFVLSLLLF